ncbi:GH1 family beta-glucosidase [Mycolicibacterium sp.]|uniref:GH1 family beta-glucosidase n=1 Tax=Mycolicibacterium sp. TaxID=2320850 RepID=UPI003D14AB14
MSNRDDTAEFPTGFVWGVATASYQIEGAVTAGGRQPSIWDTFSRKPGAMHNGDNGDVADDHYHRYREDVALLADLGVTHYRFSLAWPRLQPDGKGAINAEGLDFYARLVDELLGHGIAPWVTLYHWDLPQALEDAGGWPVRDTAARFAEYAALTHEKLHDRIRHWTTLNEPWCSAFLGYAAGAHAPGRTEPAAALAAAHHLLLGHGWAVTAMREQDPGSQLGITVNLSPVSPATGDPADVEAARRVDAVSNRIFLDPLLRGRYPDDVRADVAAVSDFGFVRPGDEAVIAVPLDFLGVNYYFRAVVQANAGAPVDDPHARAWVGSTDVQPVRTGLPTTAMGWEIDPSGLYDVLTWVHRDYGPVPIYVTENGAAFDDTVSGDGTIPDHDRIAFLDSHFRATLGAIADGADIRGYFVWSLLDNLEWAYGYSKRFGLIHVDYATQTRTPKDSARWFAGVTRRNGLPHPLVRD